MSNGQTSLSLRNSSFLSCHYGNDTERLQILRIENIQGWYFERVIFPGQTLIFNCPFDALLEVYSCELATALLRERIPCIQLRCTESVVGLPTVEKTLSFEVQMI